MSLKYLKNFTFLLLLVAPLALSQAALKKQNNFEIKEELLPDPILSTIEGHSRLGKEKLKTGGVSSMRTFEITQTAKKTSSKDSEKLMTELLNTSLLTSPLCENNLDTCTAQTIKNSKANLVLPQIQQYLKKAEEKHEKNFQFSTLMIQNFILDTVGKDFREYSIVKNEKLTSLLISANLNRALVLELDYQPQSK